MENKKLSVGAIKNDAVISHIPAELDLTILRQFKLLHYDSIVTVGFDLPSRTQGSKDAIKVPGMAFDDAAANQLALFAPEATVNIIADSKVADRRHPALPDEVAEVLRCLNANCTSHSEPMESHFYVKTQNGQTCLKCHYCEKAYSHDSAAKAQRLEHLTLSPGWKDCLKTE